MRVEVLDRDGAPTREVATGDPLRIVLELRGDAPVEQPIVGMPSTGSTTASSAGTSTRKWTGCGWAASRRRRWRS